MRRTVSLLAIVSAFALPALAASRAVRVKIAPAAPAKVAAAKPFDLSIALEIQSGYHIQAANAKDPYIPTRVAVTAPAGWKVGKPAYPAAKMVEMFGEKLAVYEGKVTVKVPVTPAPKAAGKQQLAIKVTSQACNDQACEPPSDISASCTVEVGAAARK